MARNFWGCEILVQRSWKLKIELLRDELVMKEFGPKCDSWNLEDQVETWYIGS